MVITATKSRHVPFSLCLQALFDSVCSTVGWIFLGIGLTISLIYVPRCDAVANWKFHGRLATVRGAIQRVRATAAAENAEAAMTNDTPHVIDYSFSPPGSDQIRGISYSTGYFGEPGKLVTVEYRPDHPLYSRIQGLSAGEFSSSMLLVLIFPLIGLVLLTMSIGKGVRGIRLLQSGQPAQGTLVAMERAWLDINRQRVYRMKFKFIAANERWYTAKYATQKIKPAWRIFYRQSVAKNALATEAPATSELQEVILYLPTKPACAALPVDIVAGISFDNEDNLCGVHPLRGYLVSILPLLVIVSQLLLIHHLLAL